MHRIGQVKKIFFIVLLKLIFSTFFSFRQGMAFDLNIDKIYKFLIFFELERFKILKHKMGWRTLKFGSPEKKVFLQLFLHKKAAFQTPSFLNFPKNFFSPHPTGQVAMCFFNAFISSSMLLLMFSKFESPPVHPKKQHLFLATNPY